MGKVNRGRQPQQSSPAEQALLAHALVGVDVGLAVGAAMGHILKFINQAGDEAAAQVAPGREKGNREGQQGLLCIHSPLARVRETEPWMPPPSGMACRDGHAPPPTLSPPP